MASRKNHDRIPARSRDVANPDSTLGGPSAALLYTRHLLGVPHLTVPAVGISQVQNEFELPYRRAQMNLEFYVSQTLRRIVTESLYWHASVVVAADQVNSGTLVERA